MKSRRMRCWEDEHVYIIVESQKEIDLQEVQDIGG
jgi:hypothetical protein